jgi:predicted nucleic acid-binding protein
MSTLVFVVDTNVVAAGPITGTSDIPVMAVLDAMLSCALLHLMSPALLEEYRPALLRPKLVRLHGLTEAEVDHLLVELTANAVWREPTAERQAPDRGDDLLWELLDAYAGSILITGYRILREQPPAGNSVIFPAIWLEKFAR